MTFDVVNGILDLKKILRMVSGSKKKTKAQKRKHGSPPHKIASNRSSKSAASSHVLKDGVKIIQRTACANTPLTEFQEGRNGWIVEVVVADKLNDGVGGADVVSTAHKPPLIW